MAEEETRKRRESSRGGGGDTTRLTLGMEEEATRLEATAAAEKQRGIELGRELGVAAGYPHGVRAAREAWFELGYLRGASRALTSVATSTAATTKLVAALSRTVEASDLEPPPATASREELDRLQSQLAEALETAQPLWRAVAARANVPVSSESGGGRGGHNNRLVIRVAIYDSNEETRRRRRRPRPGTRQIAGTASSSRPCRASPSCFAANP